MKKWKMAITALLIFTVLAACNQEEDKTADKQETITAVETSPVKKEDLIIEHSLYGRTAPVSSTPIILQMPGEITNLEVENGDKVDEDDTIATIQTAQGKQTIYAQAAGEIAQLQGDEGTIVNAEKPLALIVDLEELLLKAAVTAESRSLFEAGKKYPITINNTNIEGEITSVGTLPNEAGLYPIEASIKNEDKTLLPGMVAELIVPENTIQDALIIPTEAVVEESGKTFIYIIQNDKAVQKKIEIIDTQSDVTAVKGELKKDDQVVTSGTLTLTDGAKVNVVKEG
ncbi:efflux RND transporter periplasmic adaptor subunit [Virgibacillus flavescens]|uniref:efflux RND transporter periplasmic adaptor subunit n=1 Tax=Virgibacillus flavescens TaxID=1611422 RepID=UPI003D34CF5C